MDFHKLEQALDQVLALGIPGYDCAVARDGEVLWRRMEGYRHQEAGLPVTEDTLYKVFSCTKVVTCTAALQLYEQGRFLLDDYLPEFAHMQVLQADGRVVPAENRITIRQLFTMSAGLTYNMDTPGARKAKELTGGRCPTRELIRHYAQDPLAYEPGTGYEYSMAHDVLGALIEVLTGKTLGDCLRENILGPCGMEDTAFHPDAAALTRLAPLYRYDHEQARAVPTHQDITFFGPGYESGGGGLVSSAADMLRFCDALCTGKLLSRATVELMRTNHLDQGQLKQFRRIHLGPDRSGDPTRERYGYGYGLGVRTLVDPVAAGANSPVGEFGWGGIAGAYMLMDPANKLSLFYVQHVMESPTDRVRNRIRNALYACVC